MRIIDWDASGNVIRLYLGDDDLATWGGDDWDDVPYEHNAGRVEPRYVTAVVDVALAWHHRVFEPSDGTQNSRWSKDDMMVGRVPMFVVFDGAAHEDWWHFEQPLGDRASLRAYMGGDAVSLLHDMLGRCDVMAVTASPVTHPAGPWSTREGAPIDLAEVTGRPPSRCTGQDIQAFCTAMVQARGREAGMSYDIRLCDPVSFDTLHTESPHEMRGGTYVVGGTTELWLNVTYNYSKAYAKAFDGVTPGTRLTGRSEWVRTSGADDERSGIRTIYGMLGSESIPVLELAIARLGDDVDVDYWAPTEGNAKRALASLLAMAKLRPDGIWDGD